MLSWFSNLFARTSPTPAPAPAEPASAEPWFLRRWESADTNRLNRAHWQSARGQSINADLAERLKTLRLRCAYEAANNPFVEGLNHTLTHFTPHERRFTAVFAGFFYEAPKHF